MSKKIPAVQLDGGSQKSVASWLSSLTMSVLSSIAALNRTMQQTLNCISGNRKQTTSLDFCQRACLSFIVALSRQ